MTPEIDPQPAPRGRNARRILLIAVGCVLWVGLVVGAVAFQWSKISQMRQMPRHVPPPVATSPSWPSAQPSVSSAPAPRPLPKGPTPSELEAKARAGDAGAALQLARMIERQAAGQAGLMKVAFEWRLRAAEAGDAMAMAGVARAYRLGFGVERDAEQAESWTERTVAASDADHWSQIGRAFQFGLNLPQDAGEAAAWYRRAAGKRGAVDLKGLDTLPRAVFQTRPRYPFELRRRGVEGEVVVDFLVDQEGNVQNAYAIRSTTEGFEAAAVEAVSGWRFEPGRKGDVAVITHMRVPIIFTLNEEAATAAGAGRSR